MRALAILRIVCRYHNQTAGCIALPRIMRNVASLDIWMQLD